MRKTIIIALSLLIIAGGGLFFQSAFNSKKIDPSKLNKVKENNTDSNDICNFSIDLPDGFTLGKTNEYPFFFGLTDKESAGRPCKIIYGPNYKSQYEGFDGELIQINAYPIGSTSLAKLTESCCNYREQAASLENTYRYQRDGYGGQDEVLLLFREDVIYEIFWKGQTGEIENVIMSIVRQL